MWRLQGLWAAMRRSTVEWGVMTRVGFATAPSGVVRPGAAAGAHMSVDDEPRRAGSMRARLLTAFAIVGLLVVGSAVAGLLVIRSSSSAVSDVARAGVPLQRANAQLRDAVTGCRRRPARATSSPVTAGC